MADDTRQYRLPSVEERYGAPTLADLVPATYLEDELAKASDEAMFGAVGTYDALAGVITQLEERVTRAPRLHRMKYKDYLQSPEWREMRRTIVRLAQYRCERCNASDVPLQVHHKTYVNRGYEEIEDLEAICRDCHRKEHGIVD